MKLLSGTQMSALDREAIERVGLPSLVLMENAGRAFVRNLCQRDAALRDKRVVVVAGKGNNGGDGLVVARVLAERGASVRAFLLFEPERCSEQTAVQARVLAHSGVDVDVLDDTAGLAPLRDALERAHVVVDALLGIGIKGAPRAEVAEVVRLVNACSAFRVALDVPSGLDADTGGVPGVCVRADLTVCLGLPKAGLLFYPGRACVGQLEVVPIGYPRALIEGFDSGLTLLDPGYVKRRLPPRPAYSHKGSFGKVLVVAGSRGLSGAAVLCAKAALRAGTGVVHLAYPRSLDATLSTHVVEAVKHPLPERDGALDGAALEPLSALLEQVDAVALGPGLSQQPCVKALVQALLERCRVPLLLDADALNALVGQLEWLQRAQAPLVLTPHPGEFARLSATSVDEVEAQRLERALQFSKQHNAVLALKGVPTVVATPQGRALVNASGNAGLAKAGSGDVLSGIVLSLLGQGLSVAEAAACGVWLHGSAADGVERRLGQRAMLPGDVVEGLSCAFEAVESSSNEAGIF